ncbi:hypothetical protein LY76DRAFT_609162 [Colletotrichum caudatum]|nr:hypothetical protein LY76DRAFT_609162 [Colletotrichum caudatum]
MAPATDPTASSSPAASIENGGRLAPRYNWYLGVFFFQTTVVGTAAFTAPGAGNAVLFSPMTVACLVANRSGPKATFAFGTVGCVVYLAALYANNNRYGGNEWFVGAVMLSYPEPENRGKYLAYWLCYRNGGSILGGVINLAFNYRGRSTGKLDWRTYILSVVLHKMSRATRRPAPLPPPEKVIRRNGSRVQIVERISDAAELGELVRLLL